MYIEQRLASMWLTVALCGVVTMAATGEKNGEFDGLVANWILAENIHVKNKAGRMVVSLGAADEGIGLVKTHSASARKWKNTRQ